MFESVVPISFDLHRNYRVKPVDNFDFAKDVHIASVMVHEFSRAASIYPIVFLEDKEKDEFRPVVLLGLEEGENLFVKDGKWQASYVPAILRRYPFVLANTEEEGRFTICMDESSGNVGPDVDGEPMFTEDGKATELMENVKRFLAELQQMELFSQEFCKYFASKNMFTPLNMQVRVNDEVRNITGCYVINEERLNNLSDKSFIELREKRYLAPVYAHLLSLAQVERLLRFKDSSIGVTSAMPAMPESASDGGAAAVVSERDGVVMH